MYLKEINRLRGKCWLNPCGFFCFVVFFFTCFVLFCFVVVVFFTCFVLFCCCFSLVFVFFFFVFLFFSLLHFYIRFSLNDDSHVKIFYRISSSISRDSIEKKMQVFLLYLLLFIFWAFNRELILLYPNVISKNLGRKKMLFEISKNLGRSSMTHILVAVEQITRIQNI